MDTQAEALTSTKAKKSRYDAIVVGGGHNGLVCAAYLAKAGKDVLVLERRHVLGGAAVSEEIYPGFTYSVCSYVVSLFRPHIIRELELAKHGTDLSERCSIITCKVVVIVVRAYNVLMYTRLSMDSP